MQGQRRDRSRSPLSVDNVGTRRDNKHNNGNDTTNMNSSMMNQMMMSNMYNQGNMMMGGMYPNMMMPNAMMGGGMMPSTGMEMIPTTGIATSMDMAMPAAIPQTNMDMSTMGTQPVPSQTGMDMNMMGGMMMAPNMMNANMMGMYSGVPEVPVMQERKEINLKHCKLTPPKPGTPAPPRRARPPGCRTIFVGGLPDKIRESIVREIFENYGRIHTLRLSKKNFCHIRFDRESSVDAAMAISGYRIKLNEEKKKEKEEDDMDEDDESQATTGWLHVDFAASRDDQNEFERRQRRVLRAQQAQIQQMSAQQQMASRSMSSASSFRRSPSPVRVQPYSSNAMIQLNEKIKNEEQFNTALPTLLAWLEHGECSKKNANQFYSMIQATNSHIRRLFNEKVQYEDELQECRERVKNNIENVLTQLEQVAKVFEAATHQRAWDHFSKAQRKNIETWQKMTQEFNALKEEFNEKFYGEDNESNGYSMRQHNMGSSDEASSQLKSENESLKFQLEAYKNEVAVIKADAMKEMEKFKAQFIARQALQGALDKNIPPLPEPVVKPPPPPPLPGDLDAKIRITDDVPVACGEAKLIGVMSAFLQVHPQGASLDYVVSYVRGVLANVNQATVHHVLNKHTDVFQKNTTGVGANIEHRWSFVAFLKQQEDA